MSCAGPGVRKVKDDGGVHGHEVHGAGGGVDERRGAISHHAVTWGTVDHINHVFSDLSTHSSI